MASKTNVALSARVMLVFEGLSVLIIAAMVAFTLFSHGLHLDHQQLRLHGVTAIQLRLGLVLAIFSSVGFESATSLGAEARDPLRSIPRAVMLTAIGSGLFFSICSYAEVLAFRNESQSLDHSLAPLHVLAAKAGLPYIGTLVDVSAVISFFSFGFARHADLLRRLDDPAACVRRKPLPDTAGALLVSSLRLCLSLTCRRDLVACLALA